MLTDKFLTCYMVPRNIAKELSIIMMPIMKMFVGVRKKGKKNIVLCDMLEGMFTNTWPCLLGGFT